MYEYNYHFLVIVMSRIIKLGLEILDALKEKSHQEREVLFEVREMHNEMKKIKSQLDKQCLLKGENMVKKEYVKKSDNKGKMII